jgi:membrane protein
MFSPRHLWNIIRETFSAWTDDYAPSMGAAIAYYTVFSLAPLLLLVIAVAGLIFGRDAVQGEIVNQVTGLMGKEGAVAIEGLLKSASEPATSAIATVISLALLVLGATTVFAEIQNALDRIWHVPAAKKPGGLFGFLRTRLLSFGLVLGLGFLLLVSLVVSAAVAALGAFWGDSFRGWETLLQIVNVLVALVLSTALFGMIYKLMPRTPIAWRDVWLGAAVTAVLFEVGKVGIGLYLGKSGVTSGFGAAGSLAVLLVWVYYSAQIFLLGAEFTRLHSSKRRARQSGQGAHERSQDQRTRRDQDDGRPHAPPGTA